MSSNQEQIIAQYSAGKEDERATQSRSSSLEFYYTKKHLEGLIQKTDRVLEVGCATGYYGLHYAAQCREYVGVDIVPAHIAQFEQKIKERNLQNVSCAVGDATELSGIADDRFDVVLCLGPMYHLTPEEREKCFAECRRVCKPGGVLAFAYINRIGVYAGACLLFGEVYPNAQANRFVLEQGRDDVRPDMFFYTTPEEMNARAGAHGLKKIKNLATDFFVTTDIVNAMSDERFELMRPLYDQMTACESCTGMGNHALLICAKE